jgi:hypothetical protein
MGHISALPRLTGTLPFASILAPLGGLKPASGLSTSFLVSAPAYSAFSSIGLPPLLKLFGVPQLQLKSASAVQPAIPLKAATASGRNLEAIAFIEKKLKSTVYNANTKVDVDKGIFEFDCSGMVNWILERTAPTALAELKAGRPRVIEYVKALKAIPANQPSTGWRRVPKIADAEPGDVIAWPTPDWYPSDATGHMGILVAKPEAVDGGFLLRLADSTSYPHGDDSREGGTGFGYGTILVTVDPQTGAGTGQGWTGRHSYNTVIETPIYVGRPLQ